MIWILRTIQVNLDRVITRSVNRSVIDSTGFQRIHFGGHPLEQIAFQACWPLVDPELSQFLAAERLIHGQHISKHC